MNISVWPSDSGYVDTTGASVQHTLDMPDEPTRGVPIRDLPWTPTADLFTYCDVWCTPETSIDVTKPDGTVDSWNPIPDYFTGWLATYSDAGTYTVDKTDTWGDGGMGLTVGIVLGNFTGFLSATDFVFEDSATGYVDSTDTSDIFAVYIPENYAANLTLSWENSADLELNVYSSYDMTNGLSGLMAYSWFNQPEFVDLGQLGAATTVYVEVEHYAGPASGYTLHLQTELGHPCHASSKMTERQPNRLFTEPEMTPQRDRSHQTTHPWIYRATLLRRGRNMVWSFRGNGLRRLGRDRLVRP